MSERWEVATNPDEVHALLCASDVAHATREALAPERRRETTRSRVEAGAVHLLRVEGEAAAMFTLTWERPFDAAPDAFPRARAAAYISRLAVAPGRDDLIGARCVRHAAELASAAGAEVLRSEANPDLRSYALLRTLGFEPVGPIEDQGGRRSVRLQMRLGY